MANMDGRDPKEQFDPRLVELLNQLRLDPPRNPASADRGRARFLAELDSLELPTPSQSLWSRLIGWLSNRPNHHPDREEIKMSTPKSRIAFTTIAVILIVLVFLSGGSAVTALAAQSALPGDALYPVKMTLEQTRLSLSRDAANRAQLQLEFAERRLEEIEALIAEGRYQNISAATLEFQTYINNALAETDTISKSDPARAAELVLQISDSLSRFAHALSAMASNVPEPARAEMLRAVQTIQNVSGQSSQANEIEFTGVVESIDGETWLIAGRTVMVTNQTEIQGVIEVGKAVKVHAAPNGEGVLMAREIQFLEAGQDNANQNQNDNANTNLNANTNANENTNLNANTNANENANQNTNLNTNANANENANQNANATVNDNENRNENGNSNDDRANDNSEDSSGSNRNDNVNESQGNNDNDNRNENGNDNDDDDDDDDDD